MFGKVHKDGWIVGSIIFRIFLCTLRFFAGVFLFGGPEFSSGVKTCSSLKGV